MHSIKKLNNIEIISLNLKEIIKHPVYKLYKKFVGKVFYKRGSMRDKEVYIHDAERIKKCLEKIGADINIFFGEHCLYTRLDNQLCYAYIDATLRPILEAEKIRRFGIESFLRKYEKNDKKSYDLLDGVFTMNEWSRESVNKLYGKDLSKIYNIKCGINVDFYEGIKNYNNHHLLIILRKKTEHLKGLDLLLDAFKIAKKRINDLKLSVVGTEYKKVDGVKYYYNEPRSKTLELLKDASLYIMPAIKEPNGITYLEALAYKTPTIGLNRFSYPEFCGYGEYGFISRSDTAKDVANTICLALNDTNKLKEMGEKGQKFVRENYNWDIVVDKMVKQFKSEGVM